MNKSSFSSKCSVDSDYTSIEQATKKEQIRAADYKKISKPQVDIKTRATLNLTPLANSKLADKGTFLPETIEKKLRNIFMNLNEIRFATYNCGAGFNDYQFMVNANENERRTLTNEVNEKVKDASSEANFKIQTMQKIETLVANKLADQLDVIALQETKNLDRPFCQTLRERGFTFFRLESTDTSPENVIAVRNRYSVENISIQSESDPNDQKSGQGQQIAGVIILINDQCKIAFTSLHSWGFKLFSEKQWNENAIDQNQWAHDKTQRNAAYTYMKEALSEVKKHNPTFSVIAGDLNNNPVNFEEPFKLYKANGFETHEPDQPTNVNYSETEYPNRKTDYIFTSKPSLWKRCIDSISSIFRTTHSVEITPPRVLEGFDFTMETNCSDHKPFGTTITIREIPSKLSRFCAFVKHFFDKKETSNPSMT